MADKASPCLKLSLATLPKLLVKSLLDKLFVAICWVKPTVSIMAVFSKNCAPIPFKYSWLCFAKVSASVGRALAILDFSKTLAVFCSLVINCSNALVPAVDRALPIMPKVATSSNALVVPEPNA